MKDEPLARGLFMLRLTLALALAACSDDPVLSDRDAGPMLTDGSVPDGGRDAAAPDGSLDAGDPDGGGPLCDGVPPTVPADPVGGEFEARFGTPGVSGPAPAVTQIGFTSDGDVIAAGDFELAGYLPVRNIARFDATTGWSALGDGIEERILAMVVTPTDQVIVAFQDRDDFEIAHIARFDGTSWTEIGVTEGGLIQTLELAPDGGVYAGGYFTRIGGVAASRVARYDGTWAAVAGLAIDNGVSAIEIQASGDMCIAGDFTTLGTLDAQSVACRVGGVWQARSLPPFYLVNDLHRDTDGTLLVAGNFVVDGALPTDGGGIARWVTDHWETVGGGVTEFPEPGHGGLVRGIAVATHGLYAGGSFNFAGGARSLPTESVARYAGGEWSDIGGLIRDMGAFIDENVWAVATGPDDSVYFGGLFTTAGTVRAAHIVRYDGTYWRALRAGQIFDGIAGNVMALEARASCGIYIGGVFTYAGEIRADNVVFYSRAGGYQELGPGVDGQVNALAASSDGRLFAGGAFVNRGGDPFSGLAMWDGATWSGLAAGAPDNYVWSLALHESTGAGDPERLYVAGNFTRIGGTEARAIAVWDGSTLTELGGGLTGHVPVGDVEPAPARAYALLLERATGDLIVGGSFARAGTVPVMNIARWDGAEWHPFGDGLGDLLESVLSLEIHGGRLYAGGTFKGSGATSLEAVAVWTGTAWENVGEGLSSSTPPDHYGRTVAALSSVGSALYAGGIFSATPGEPESMIAVYDGTSWRDLDAGMSDLVNALAWQSEGVYAGGAFGRAGSTPSTALALWNLSE